MRKLILILALIIFTGSTAFAFPPVMPSRVDLITASDCNVAANYPIGSPLCQDTDDAKLYKGTGAAVEEIASGAFAVTDITGAADDSTPATTATAVLAQGGSLIESTLGQIGTAINPTAATLHIDDILTALGIASEATHFGTFTGSTINDSVTAKAALQALETALEALGGDVTGVGDCADGACYDGSADGGTYVRLYDGTGAYLGMTAGVRTLTLLPSNADAESLVLTFGDNNNVVALSSGTGGLVNISGSAGSATLATTVTVAASADATSSVAFFETTDGSLGAKTDPGLTYDATANILTATGGFAGPINGTVGATTPAAVAATTITGTSSATLGVNATTAGTLKLYGGTSGDVTFTPTAVSGTTAITIPATSGTMAVLASGACAAAGCTGFDGTDLFTWYGANADALTIRVGSTDANAIIGSVSDTITNLSMNTMIVSANGFTPDAADGAALGSAALEFSDLYLAAGGVIYGEADQSNTLTSSATGWTANLNMVVTGQLSGRVPVMTDADGKTLSGTDLYGSMQMSTGAGTWTIPDVDAAAGTGQSFCIYATAAHEIVIAGDAEDKIRLGGTLGAAGGDITNNTAEAAGDFICLMLTDFATDVAHWTVLGKSGTWTVVP